MRKTKVYPINDCRECPKFNEEPIYYECRLSDVRCYEKDIPEKEWIDYLEMYCPLSYMEDIIDEAFGKGQEYAETKKEMITNAKMNSKPTHWMTGDEFLEYMEKTLKGE